jgi:hypothetical protein
MNTQTIVQLVVYTVISGQFAMLVYGTLASLRARSFSNQVTLPLQKASF